MKYFTIYNSQGEILRSGQVPDEAFDLQKQEGEFIIEQPSDPEFDAVDFNAKTIIKGGKPPPPLNMDYAQARYEAYPRIQDQLDMLWHSMDRNEIPRAEPFYSRIKAVKQAYPTDNSVIPGSVRIISGV